MIIITGREGVSPVVVPMHGIQGRPGKAVVLFIAVLVSVAPASAGFHADGVDGGATASAVGAQATTIDGCT